MLIPSCSEDSQGQGFAPELFKFVGIKRYQFFKLYILHAKIFNQICENSLFKCQLRMSTPLPGGVVSVRTASDSMVFQPADIISRCCCYLTGRYIRKVYPIATIKVKHDE